MRRPLISLIAAALLLGTLAGPAFATDPPANDLFENATVISSVPFTETVDTSGATTDATDAAANEQCGAPATEASVWYTLTQPADAAADYLVDVSASDYSAGVIVVTGTPDAFAIATCGPGAVGFFAAPGETYSIVAFSDIESVNGGMLTITVDILPPPPTIEVSIDPRGSIDTAGHVTLTGTVTCSSPTFVELGGDIRQRAGRVYINGFFGTGVWCEEEAAWMATTEFEDGVFVGGRATARVFAMSCFWFAEAEATVQLRPTR